MPLETFGLTHKETVDCPECGKYVEAEFEFSSPPDCDSNDLTCPHCGCSFTASASLEVDIIIERE